MRVEAEVNGRRIIAVSMDERPRLEAPALEIDCRKAMEIPADEPPPVEGGPPRVRLPFTGTTLSEQDMDQFRREFARSPGPIVVMSDTGMRAASAVLAHAGRVLGWSPEDALARCPGLEGHQDLARFVRGYLERHADRRERKDYVGQ